MEIVEVGTSTVDSGTECQLGPYGFRRYASIFLAGIVWRAVWLLGVYVVVGTEDNFPVRISAPKSLCHGQQVAAVEGDDTGIASGHVQTGTGGVSFAEKQRAVALIRRGGNLAERARGSAARKKIFFAVAINVLKRGKLTLFVPKGENESARIREAYFPKDIDALTLQIGMIGVCNV